MSNHYYRKFDWPEDMAAYTLGMAVAEARKQQADHNHQQNKEAYERSQRTGQPMVYGWIDALQGHHVLHKKLTWRGWVRKLLFIRKPVGRP